MKIISSTGTVKNPVIAIGVFDGLHLGHQFLIRKVVERAKALNTSAVVMTFDPHPAEVLRPENHFSLLISLQYRIKLITLLGVDAIAIVKFTKRFSRLSPKQFVKNYLVKRFTPKEIIVGDDFRFGQNRAGTIEFFKEAGQEFGFKVLSVKTTQKGQKNFSSTLAKQAIVSGDLKKAAKVLGRPVSIMGKVTSGDKRGKLLGFPTANLVPQKEILPPNGVYIVRVLYKGKSLQGMANIGVRPSFHKKSKLNIEVHIFNFNKNIYGHEIVIEFLQRIRDEVCFPSKQALIAQLKKDELISLRWFSRSNLK